MSNERERKMSGNLTLNGVLGSYSCVSDDKRDQGGNGVIYNVVGRDDLVVKVFKSRPFNRKLRLHRFAKEINFLEDHKNLNKHIPIIIDKNLKSEQPFFVMKKYYTIYDFYKKHPSNQYILRICLELIDAIQYIHLQNTAHRDVKPRNLLFEFNKNGFFKNLLLTDYGLIIDEEDTPLEGLGSSTFSPPELIDRSIESDSSTEMFFGSDVYEFAKTVYALLNREIRSFSDGIYRLGIENEIKMFLNDDNLFIEPIYEMIEKSIKPSINDRIGLDECRNYILQAINLIKNPQSKLWLSKRHKRRDLSSILCTSCGVIQDTKSIEKFMLKLFYKEYDLEIDNKRFVVEDVTEINRNSSVNNLIKVFKIKTKNTGDLFFDVKEVIIIDKKEREFEINVRILDSNLNGENYFSKCKLIKKQDGIVLNDFKL